MKKKKNKEYSYSGESILAPIWEKLAEDINEQRELGLIDIIYDEDTNVVELRVIDNIGLAIWYNNKFNKIKWEEYLDEFKKKEKNT